ncbi:hypothetical protein HYG81_08860 [Natrinema zhouii]|uniref:Uncharacterized protein n=1 Tax=Natrinema zhouii TaxID=1710539 RepID=A0A7D6CQZ7_9EURY|nr:hypothetical protein [Natrinema zhouii]QLK27695.1 hypothetical protein HYG81_08860 [Natrinema zhouii]
MERNRYTGHVPDWLIEVVVAVLVTISIHIATVRFVGIESDALIFLLVISAVLGVQSVMRVVWTETASATADSER